MRINHLVRNMSEPDYHHYLQSGDGDSDTLGLPSIVDVAFDYRRMIAIIACCFVAFGALYTVLHEPVYRGDLVVQLEDNSSPPVTGPLTSTNIAPSGDTKSKTDGEIQLLGSRAVVSRAVD